MGRNYVLFVCCDEVLFLNLQGKCLSEQSIWLLYNTSCFWCRKNQQIIFFCFVLFVCLFVFVHIFVCFANVHLYWWLINHRNTSNFGTRSTNYRKYKIYVPIHFKIYIIYIHITFQINKTLAQLCSKYIFIKRCSHLVVKTII